MVVKYFANKEEVEKQVANNTKELETKLVEQQKTIEEYKDRMKEVKDLAEGYKLNSEKLAEQSEALREDLSRSRSDLAQMAEKTKSLAVATENQSSSKRDFTSKRWLLSLLSLQWLAERSWDHPTLLVIIINKHRLKLKHLFREWKIRLGQIRTLLQQIVAMKQHQLQSSKLGKMLSSVLMGKQLRLK